ncbi:hypothetical protein GCM10017783_01460 [Deinococcus piscis]|uniref:ABC transporter domain-containing protein n=1 Tax=Deinococcus piscis TaxID=394230 RepID=A0ABQ3K3B0_9DEIO|nr:ABC transporter ATP-binding protein [Deinococcus piscis]GHF93242.1 hypothetical protein GCM10017783_01460 [Deinococcus piscis]
MTALAVQNISKTLGDHLALQQVTLKVEPGSIHALVGLNGAGKTTLMRVMLGMLRPDGGRVTLLGHDLAHAPSSLWRQVGHQIEVPPCYPELTARQNLWVAAQLRGVPEQDISSRITQVAEALNMSAWIDRRARTLSLGTRQKIGLGAALLHDPCVLVLDEPGNALDPLALVRLRGLLRRAAVRGAAVLVSSHHLDELARMADHISVMHRGQIIGTLDPQAPDLERAFFSKVLAQEEAGAAV